MARADLHRPAEIAPRDYRHLFSFSYPGSGGGVDAVPFNTELLAAVRTGRPQRVPVYDVDCWGGLVVTGHQEITSPWGKLPFFQKPGGSSGCDVCGAHYRHGDAFLHEPSGEVVLLGHICGEKMELVTERGEWTSRQKELAKLRKTATYRRAKAEARERVKSEAVEFLANHPGLEEALEAEHHIAADLKEKLWKHGGLTSRQVDLARKLAREAREKAEAAKNAPPEVMPPEGRQQIEGKVLSSKWQDSAYGGGEKMLVEVKAEGGVFRVWGTAPESILWKPAEDGGGHVSRELRGERVRFTATVKPKEVGFGFFSRPAKAEIVEAA